jgi:glutaredoxin
MKKILIAAAVIAAGYHLYNQSGSNVGVYADDGTPQTIFFATEQCGQACDMMRRFLKSRVPFEEIDAFDNGPGSDLYKKYGGTGFLPYVVMGKQRVTGRDRGGIISSVAAEFGLEKVKEIERKALQRNFDASGNARLVMYATERCGYCKKARQYFVENGIDYVEYDIERDRLARRDYDALLGTGTPLLYNGYARMAGFNERQIKSRLNL